MIHRASNLGSCTKSQIAAALGLKPIPHSEQSLRVMGEGQLHEDDVVAQLRADGCIVERQQEEVNLRFPGLASRAVSSVSSAWVQGHLDGVVTLDLNPESRVLEVKSMGDSTFKQFKAKGWNAGGLIDRYKWQISVYMLATGLEAYLVAKNRNSGELLRHGIELPFHSLEEITARVAYIEDHVSRRDLQGARCDPGANTWFCPYRDRICDTKVRSEEAATAKLGAPTSLLPELDVALTTQLALSEYAALSDQIRVLQATVAADVKALEAAQKVLKPILQEGLAAVVPNQKYQLNGYEVTWVEQPVAASIRRFARIKKIED